MIIISNNNNYIIIIIIIIIPNAKPIEEQSLPTDCWPHVHFSAFRGVSRPELPLQISS